MASKGKESQCLFTGVHRVLFPSGNMKISESLLLSPLIFIDCTIIRLCFLLSFPCLGATFFFSLLDARSLIPGISRHKKPGPVHNSFNSGRVMSPSTKSVYHPFSTARRVITAIPQLNTNFRKQSNASWLLSEMKFRCLSRKRCELEISMRW